MRKYILVSFVVMLILAACESKPDNRPKTYTYQVVMAEVNNKVVLVGEEPAKEEWTREPDTLMVVNDTTAYLDAYRRLCSYKVFYVTLNEENSPKSVYPVKFILKNSAGKDVIETMDMPDRKEREDKIWQNTLDFERRYYGADSVKLARLERAEQPRF